MHPEGSMNATKIPTYEARKSLLRGESLESTNQVYAGGYHDREGYYSSAPADRLEGSKMYRPNSVWTWSFVIVTIVQAAIVLGFEGFVFDKFQTSLAPGAGKSVQARTIPTYLTLFIFGFLYQLVLVWDALRLKNTIQIIGLCIYNLGLLIYAAVQKDQIHDAVDTLEAQNQVASGVDIWPAVRPFMIAVPCVLGFGTVLMSVIAWKLYDEFAWSIYKHISADLRMKRRYLTYQIYIALLKFDFFFFLGFTVQFVVIVVNDAHQNAEFGLTIAAIPITILILFAAGFITRRENKPGMIAIILLYFAALAYFIFKLYRLYQHKNKPNEDLAHKDFDYTSAEKSLTTFAVIAVILIVLTIVNACVCISNFGKGLKPHIMRRKFQDDDEKANMTEMPNIVHGQIPSRMTID